jgi:hypothetical protein
VGVMCFKGGLVINWTDSIFSQMTGWKASYYKEYLKVDKSIFARKKSKMFTSNLIQNVLTINDPMKLVIIGHLYFDYLFGRALEESGVNIKERRYQSFRAKIEKLNSLGHLDNSSYVFFTEINKLRNLFAHNIFFDITKWDPSKLPQIEKYQLSVPKRKDLLRAFSIVIIQTCYFTLCIEFSDNNHWVGLEDVPKT